MNKNYNIISLSVVVAVLSATTVFGKMDRLGESEGNTSTSWKTNDPAFKAEQEYYANKPNYQKDKVEAAGATWGTSPIPKSVEAGGEENAAMLHRVGLGLGDEGEKMPRPQSASQNATSVKQPVSNKSFVGKVQSALKNTFTPSKESGKTLIFKKRVLVDQNGNKIVDEAGNPVFATKTVDGKEVPIYDVRHRVKVATAGTVGAVGSFGSWTVGAGAAALAHVLDKDQTRGVKRVDDSEKVQTVELGKTELGAKRLPPTQSVSLEKEELAAKRLPLGQDDFTYYGKEVERVQPRSLKNLEATPHPERDKLNLPDRRAEVVSGLIQNSKAEDNNEVLRIPTPSSESEANKKALLGASVELKENIGTMTSVLNKANKNNVEEN